MPLRNIINAAFSVAQGAGRIGKLYPHLIHSVSDADMLTFFQDANGRIDVGMLTREKTGSQDKGPNRNYDQHFIVLRWYRSVQRAADDSINTEDGFQDDVEAVRLAFKANRKLTVNGVNNSHWLDPMEARQVTYVMFQGVLCHYAELTVTAGDGPQGTSSI